MAWERGKSMGKWGKMEGVVTRAGKVVLTWEHEVAQGVGSLPPTSTGLPTAKLRSCHSP